MPSWLRTALVRDCSVPLLVVGDGVLVAGTWLVARRFAAWMGEIPVDRVATWGFWLRLGIALLVYGFFFSHAGLYRRMRFVRGRGAVASAVLAVGSAFVVLAALGLLLPGPTIGRVGLVTQGAILPMVLGVWRLGAASLLSRIPDPRATIVLGANALGVRVANLLSKQGAGVLGLVGLAGEEGCTEFGAHPNFGAASALEAIAEGRGVARVVVAPMDPRSPHLPVAALMRLRARGVEVASGVEVYEEMAGHILADRLHPHWWLRPGELEPSELEKALVRGANAAVAATGLALVAPLLVLVALAIRVDSKGPVLYSQERVGLGGGPFRMHKFRTMRTDAEVATGPVWAAQDDPRVTPIGRVLRRTRIDELPQLWNVLKGDMDLIGPRPERPCFVQALEKELPLYALRHLVRPGITGWAQVNHGYTSTATDSFEKLMYDLYSLKFMSARLVVEVLLGSVVTVVTGRGAR